jgi:hypothetical protein
LGGFWTAEALAGRLGGIPANDIVIRIYPRRRGLFEGLSALMGRSEASLRALEGLETLMAIPGIKNLIGALAEVPRGKVEMRVPGLLQ